MRRTTAISLVCGMLLAGVVLGRLGVGATGWLVLVAAGVAVALVRTRLAVGALVTAAVLVGLWRAAGWRAEQAALVSRVGQSVMVQAVVADDPGYDPRGFMTYHLGDLRVDGRPQPGSLSVYMQQINLHRGWRVQAVGKVKPGFGNDLVELSYPKVTVMSTSQSWLERLRQRFFTGTRTALAEPLASFALGLLVGVRALIPKDLQAQLALVGLSHLVAVSGYNLTIIVAAAHRLLERLGRGVALAASLWLIGGFLLVTGSNASIVRASLVTVLGLLAAFYGRRFEPVALIALAAGATAAYDPGFVTDLGWLLSFLAFFGIMVLAPAVVARVGNPKNVLVRLFIESTAAQVITTPLIAYAFGQLSVVGPLTNLLVLPMVPIAMLVSFVAGLAGMVVPAWAGWLAWPAELVLRLMLGIVDYAARLPWAGTTVRISAGLMLAMYGVLLMATMVVRRVNGRRGVVEAPPVAERLAAGG